MAHTGRRYFLDRPEVAHFANHAEPLGPNKRVIFTDKLLQIYSSQFHNSLHSHADGEVTISYTLMKIVKPDSLDVQTLALISASLGNSGYVWRPTCVTVGHVFNHHHNKISHKHLCEVVKDKLLPKFINHLKLLSLKGKRAFRRYMAINNSSLANNIDVSVDVYGVPRYTSSFPYTIIDTALENITGSGVGTVGRYFSTPISSTRVKTCNQALQENFMGLDNYIEINLKTNADYYEEIIPPVEMGNRYYSNGSGVMVLTQNEAYRFTNVPDVVNTTRIAKVISKFLGNEYTFGRINSEMTNRSDSLFFADKAGTILVYPSHHSHNEFGMYRDKTILRPELAKRLVGHIKSWHHFICTKTVIEDEKRRVKSEFNNTFSLPSAISPLVYGGTTNGYLCSTGRIRKSYKVYDKAFGQLTDFTSDQNELLRMITPIIHEISPPKPLTNKIKSKIYYKKYEETARELNRLLREKEACLRFILSKPDFHAKFVEAGWDYTKKPKEHAYTMALSGFHFDEEWYIQVPIILSFEVFGIRKGRYSFNTSVFVDYPDKKFTADWMHSIHPHVNGAGSMCTGSHYEEFNQAVAAGDPVWMKDLFLRFLNTFTPYDTFGHITSPLSIASSLEEMGIYTAFYQKQFGLHGAYYIKRTAGEHVDWLEGRIDNNDEYEDEDEDYDDYGNEESEDEEEALA